MLKHVRKFAHRLLSIRNLVAILTISLAIIGSLGIQPFGIQYSTEQLVLAVLAFLAIDSLVERLDLLTDISTGVETIQKALIPKTTASSFLKRRRDFPRMEELIENAMSDIWITGVTFDSIVPFVASLESRLRQGCKVRLLAPDPDGIALKVAANYYGYDLGPYAGRLRTNLTLLASRLLPIEDGSLEVRVVDTLFPAGYIVTDRNTSAGRCIVQSYLYQTNPQETPVFTLFSKSDRDWFSIHMLQLEKAWENAKTFQVHTSPEESDLD